MRRTPIVKPAKRGPLFMSGAACRKFISKPCGVRRCSHRDALSYRRGRKSSKSGKEVRIVPRPFSHHADFEHGLDITATRQAIRAMLDEQPLPLRNARAS